MRRRVTVGAMVALAVGLLLAGCTLFQPATSVVPMSEDPQQETILIFHGRIPGNLSAEIEAADGDVLDVIEPLNMALVRGSGQGYLEAIDGLPGLSETAPNITANWLPSMDVVELEPESIGDDEWYFGLQWALQAIDAPGAWDAGVTGAGVRVAVLDTGVDYNHPDLLGQVNLDLSISFVEGEPDVMDHHFHGTHVSGIIAAADNEVGVIGVAPGAEIVGIKVLGADGSGDFFWMMQGLVHAADNDCDIANMSLGAYFSHNGYYKYDDNEGVWHEVYVGAAEINALLNAMRSAINYATQEGVLVVASAGNGSLNGQGDSGWMHTPSDLGDAVCVSATGPVGWWYDPTTDLDLLASYSDYGPQIDFAAPGGDAQLWPEPFWGYDMVLSCSPGGFTFAAGTSQAAPHVAGVAALIIEAGGGDMKPAHVLRELRACADDLGKPGQDTEYGYGRVNAYQAVAP